MTMSGRYDPVLVGLSVFVAVFASYTAFEVISRVRAAQGYRHLAWLGGAAVTTGGAIWSMHFVGMLAFDMGMPVRYGLGLTLASLVLPMVVTGLGVFLVTQDSLTTPRLASGGALMGLGIVTMHYLGMAGMEMATVVEYDPALVGLSVVIAVSTATLALWLTARKRSLGTRIASSCAMGAAIAGMHYTAMAAATFVMIPDPLASADPGLDPALLAATVAIATALIQLLAIAVVYADRQKTLLAEKEVLLREVHHRVKNNLHVVASLLVLEAQAISDPATLERLRNIRARIDAIGRIHANLYQAEDVARIDIGGYLERLVQDIAALHRGSFGIWVEITADRLLCDVDTAIPLGLVANEAVTNSLKHGFPEGRSGRVEVLLRRFAAEDTVELVVADDGVGLPKGADLKPSGLGMRLIRSLAEQIDAQITVCSRNGLRVTMTIDRSRFQGSA